MRKNSIAIISLAFLASCFMVSCSTEAFDTNQPVKGAKIVIPAQKISTKAVDAEGKATFLISENVYIAKSGTIDANAIHPSEESASTTFKGTLAGTYSQGDKITVLYNTNASGVVDYSGQDGSIGSVKDAGYAEDIEIVSYSEGVLTTKPANIQNLQSIFKFSFTNNSSSISGIRSVQISSKDGKLLSLYNVITPDNSSYGSVTVSSTTDLTDVYAALRFYGNDGDVISFEVVDNAGNVYQGSKNAPSGGFENGKFYTASVNVTPVYKTLSALKSAINATGANITNLRSTYVGKYVDKDGNLHDTKEAGDIGIIMYLDSEIRWWNSDFGGNNHMTSQGSIDFSNNRMLILALTSFTDTWTSLSTNGFTYSVQKPTGSTQWYVPSKGQMLMMGLNTSPTGVAAIYISTLSEGFYWSSTQNNATKGNQLKYKYGSVSWTSDNKDSTFNVIPCFAY